jgi:hypothetical protein
MKDISIRHERHHKCYECDAPLQGAYCANCAPDPSPELRNRISELEAACLSRKALDDKIIADLHRQNTALKKRPTIEAYQQAGSAVHYWREEAERLAKRIADLERATSAGD